MIKPKAVVLFSGGLDSATCLALALEQGYEPYALTIIYGQRHVIEAEHAARIAQMYDVHHKSITIPLGEVARSALTDDGIDVPKGRSAVEIGSGIPDTYVPARNLIFLGVAMAYAETVVAETVFIGCNFVDHSGYPDCRRPFLAAFELAAMLGTRAGHDDKPIGISAPLIEMSKAAIRAEAERLDVPVQATWSCYAPNDGVPCGECDACKLRGRA